MSGYNLVIKIKSLEEECDRLGFMMCHSKLYNNEFGDVVALKCKDRESLPLYSRDAEIFIGTLSQLESWLQGFEVARKYDSMLFGNKHDSVRQRKEKDLVNKQLLKTIKEGKLVDGAEYKSK